MQLVTTTAQKEALQLRPFTPADVTDYFELVQNNDIAASAGFTPINELMAAQYLLSRQLNQPQVFALVLVATGKVIGSVGLYERMNHRGEPAPQQMDLGYMLNEAYWRRGYMSAAVQLIKRYAFQTLTLHRLTASCLAPNVASRLILEHAGFQQYDQVTHPQYAQFGAGQTELFFECLPNKGDD
ncbi:N-acetyltransferase [Lactobacillus sp.] [Lactiplantibacillus mudanjiangensis]|uniref:GNAT family N-acetyltransferase n=1 Tax=Lactiplantibacillus mudanjiangensis TaxID=1296538 RepID=UPI001014BB0D|nr:N-acetyltransferase [Lactobacillus sp.] [Lactiplantibacillus mudanjiangensis]